MYSVDKSESLNPRNVMIPLYRPICTPVHVHSALGVLFHWAILFPSSGGNSGSNSLVVKLSSGADHETRPRDPWLTGGELVH